MKKEWFFDRYCGYRLAALLEDGKLAEFAAEQENGGEIVGNIYKGRVMNVLTGMNAAFISCGLDRNCYLSMDETYTDYSKYDGTLGENIKPQLDLKVGDEITGRRSGFCRSLLGKLSGNGSLGGRNPGDCPSGKRFVGYGRRNLPNN